MELLRKLNVVVLSKTMYQQRKRSFLQFYHCLKNVNFDVGRLN